LLLQAYFNCPLKAQPAIEILHNYADHVYTQHKRT